MSTTPMRLLTAVVVAALLAGAYASGLAIATAGEETAPAGTAPTQAGAAAARPARAIAGDKDGLIERMAVGFPVEFRIAQPGRPQDATMLSMAIVP